MKPDETLSITANCFTSHSRTDAAKQLGKQLGESVFKAFNLVFDELLFVNLRGEFSIKFITRKSLLSSSTFFRENDTTQMVSLFFPSLLKQARPTDSLKDTLRSLIDLCSLN